MFARGEGLGYCEGRGSFPDTTHIDVLSLAVLFRFH
jgi:hypothetical protein